MEFGKESGWEADCEALLRKYREILRLRRASDEAPQEAMAALAREFPGALREADDLPMPELERRVESLRAVRAAEEPPAAWMLTVARYHRLVRGALVIKRWLRGRKALDGALREELFSLLPTLPFPRDTELWASEVDAIAHPPGGRLTRLVMDRLARELDVERSVVHSLLFSVSSVSSGRSPLD